VTPRIVMLVAPSGSGKTTIAREVLDRHPQVFGYSVSATTRRPRPGEMDGKAYHFLTREEFERRRRAGEFLEWAEYAGELYGTLKSEVDQVLRSGRHALLDIEVNGARQVRRADSSAIGIFMIPPSPDVLIERLRKRRTESEAALQKRLEIAVHEVKTAEQDVRAGIFFDHVLVNDDLESVVREVVRIANEPGVKKHETMDMAFLLAAFVGKLELEAESLKRISKGNT